MRVLKLHRLPIDPIALEGEFVDPNRDVDVEIDDECRVEDADTGEPVAILLRNRVPRAAALNVWRVIRKQINSLPDNRRMASGKKLPRRVGPNGTTDAVDGNAMTPSGPYRNARNNVFGALDPASARNPMCRHTAMTTIPEVWKPMTALSRILDEQFREALPGRYAAQREVADKVLPEWLIAGTVFSTITLNRNWQVAYHYDAGDCVEGFGVMFQWRSGEFVGGHFVLPAYGLMIRYDMGDILLANVHELHGITRIVPGRGKWERGVGVFYLRPGLTRCRCREEEATAAAMGDGTYKRKKA